MKKESSDSSESTATEPQAVETSPAQSSSLLWLWLALLLLVLVAAAGGYVYHLYQRIETELIPAQANVYELKKGANALTASSDLLGDRVPNFLLHLYLHEHPEFATVQAGDYLIDGQHTLPQILEDMVAGRVLVQAYPTFTIVEGSTWPEILAKIQKLPQLDEPTLEILKTPRKLHEAAMEPELLGWVGGSNANLEGLLLPATYPVFDKRPFGAVIAHALREMALFLHNSWAEKSEDITLTPYEILIVASIVERETQVDQERPLVAAVIYNRLKKGMRLQMDPAVMYGVAPTFRGKLTREMLQKDTPYNTYVHEGLPPTPIGMPSKASILAALKPERSEVLYFVAKGISPKDGHVFSSSLKEHNKAVAEYRKKVKNFSRSQTEGQAQTESDKQAVKAEKTAKGKEQAAKSKGSKQPNKSSGSKQQ